MHFGDGSGDQENLAVMFAWGNDWNSPKEGGFSPSERLWPEFSPLQIHQRRRDREWRVGSGSVGWICRIGGPHSSKDQCCSVKKQSQQPKSEIRQTQKGPCKPQRRMGMCPPLAFSKVEVMYQSNCPNCLPVGPCTCAASHFERFLSTFLRQN